MNKKLLIVANNAEWKSWPVKIEELKKWFAPRVNLDISLVHTNFSWIPFEQYGIATQDGVSKIWYDIFVAPYGKGYDVVLFVVNKSQWNSVGARGWRDNIDYGAIGLQVGADEFEPFWKRLIGIDGEMFHQVARHEILHALFVMKCGFPTRFDLPPAKGECLDTTHYHFDRYELEKALIDLVPEEPKTPKTPEMLPEILIIHHTATPRDATNLDALIADQKRRYGRSFYQVIITSDGKAHRQHNILNTRIGAMSEDIAVVGNFTIEKPTERQLDTLSRIVGKRKYIKHGEAVNYGATRSECPATLLNDLEEYRSKLNKMGLQLSWIAKEIKRIFNFK